MTHGAAPMLDRTNLAVERPTYVTHLVCGMTGEVLPADRLHNLSPRGYPILVRYDLDRIKREWDRGALAERAPDLWRYRELLPVRARTNIVTLGETATPLIPIATIAARHGLAHPPLIKDEGRLPTGSFKARGLALAVAMAKELGVTRMAIPSNGNAGAALAAYGHRAGMMIDVFCPADTPDLMLREIAAHGADVRKIDGYITDCGKLVGEGARAGRWFDVSTLKEPYRIEGKKTMGLELAEQLGWTVPDVIFYPTGGGTGLIGMWKAFAELEAIGWIGAKRPKLVAVQAAGCAPIVRAYAAGLRRAEPWRDAATVAMGIRVPAAIGDFLILDAVRASGGFAVAVDDDAILAARAAIGADEGLLLCPEGAATVAAYTQALASGRIGRNEQAVLFNCGNGLKYPLPEISRAAALAV